MAAKLSGKIRRAIGTTQTTLIAMIGMMMTMGTTQAKEVPLEWVGDQTPRVAQGVTWGVPFAKGEVPADMAFSLSTPSDTGLPLQWWPMAYWPDGTLKWVGFASKLGPDAPLELTLRTIEQAPNRQPGGHIIVRDNSDAVAIDTGVIRATIPKSGAELIESLSIGDRETADSWREVARNGRLELLHQNEPPADVYTAAEVGKFTSEIKRVTVEQDGPIQAVVKIEGMHKAEGGGREWLPFVVRLYFTADAAPVKMVHTFIWDGDQNKDFVRAMGILFDVPMREEIHNRHVRFGGVEDGVWAEPIEPLLGWRGGVRYPQGSEQRGWVYNDQVEGRRLPNLEEFDPRSRDSVENFQRWGDYRLMQPNATGFTIEKRTGAHSAWIDAAAGSRASGLVFAGDVSGGLAVGLKDFWESYPKSLEIRDMREDTAQLRVWLWSPDAPVMDVRHYSDYTPGLDYQYEDVEMELATAMGIARTHELMLYPSANVPERAVTSAHARDADVPPVLMARPEHLHEARAFGVWALPDRSTPFKAAVEEQLDAGIEFFKTAIEDHNWYGFWNYGDVMHGYDPARHMWRYDIGGFAWDNSEQGTDMWLWYLFLRSGRADIFRMAEAMTRHTGEVDFHHIGPLAGLGSRHNVRHWGDGAKEARISMAAYRRFHHYLTTDERSGDVMRDALQAGEAYKHLDPMRKADPPVEGDEKFKARLRGGPDWFAFLSNWATEWERTGDPKWKEKIDRSVASIEALPFWFKTGRNLLWGFDPDTGEVFVRDPNPGGYNLVQNMGGPEVMMEFVDHIDNPSLTKIWLQYCRLTGTNDAELLKRDQETGAEGADARFAGGGKMAAYAYYKTGIEAFAEKAIGGIGRVGYFDRSETIDGPEVIKPIVEGPTGLVTNDNNNMALHAVQVLEMCKDQLPAEVPAPPRRGGFGRRP